MKYIFLLSMAFLSFNSFSLMCFLESQSTNQYGDTLCSYDNGTVLNIGVGLCPLSIDC